MCTGFTPGKINRRRLLSNPGIKTDKSVKLGNFGIRLNVAVSGGGAQFVSRFRSYSYWLDADKLIEGSKIIVLEIWINNRRLVRCFQNTSSRLLFCEIASWPNADKQQIVMADFCREGETIPNGTVRDIYQFMIRLFEERAAVIKRPGRILNVLANMRKYESLLFPDGINQF